MLLRKMLVLFCAALFLFGIFPMAGCADKSAKKVLHESQNGIDTMDDGRIREELTSSEVVVLMGNGINLGNTMEAYGRKELGTAASVVRYETYWGQPETTQEMVTAMKTAGFDTLRIPVAWTNAMNFESGDYTIREDYLNRVEEIINYALNEDMYVIVNDHWDGGWWGMFGSAKKETREAAMDLYVSMWTQIAGRYKEYSDYLIFESANEELGDRLNDVDLSPDSGTLSKDQCYETANRINQAFVDTVRGTGGNNAKRFLLIAGYNTDIKATCDDRFSMPNDTAEDRLLLSVHYYTPWGFCGGPSVSRWGKEREYKEQNELLAMMRKFSDQGIGIVIGEYMVALMSDGSVKENTVMFFENLLDNCDLYGFCPVLWDCSSLFIRKDPGFFDPGVADFFSQRSLSTQSKMKREDIRNAATSRMEAALAAAVLADAAAAEAGVTITIGDEIAVAWIMFNSNDWTLSYSVGDLYDPTSKSDGLVATDVEIKGAGTYTVGLDFTGTELGYANSTAFSALAIANGELLFPGYLIEIREIKINGGIYQPIAEPFTTSDDGICTRVNLYNGWVEIIPEEARNKSGDLSEVSAVIIDNRTERLRRIQTIEITFDYIPGE
ncbi:MAG: glycoside hydrolase family 5 protein [Clostridiaceae bacterium]|nr:glycoside hydrolase family 5 protein [Clostridiaceae bacterium]